MSTLRDLQSRFQARYDDIARIATHHFRGYGPEARQEAVQNTAAMAWKFFLRLDQQGKADREDYFQRMIGYAIRQTKAGRMPQGRGAKKPKCVFDYGRRRYGGVSLQDGVNFNVFVGQQAAIPDIAAFRIDMPAFLATLSERNRGIALDLAAGMGTGEVAHRWGVTPAAISQFRLRFKRWYGEFHGEAA